MDPTAPSVKLASERRFFFYMAVAILFTVLVGFGSQLVARHLWFTDFPWQVHVHALIFSSWIVLYAVQNWLVVGDRNVALHRQLGWVGAGIAAADRRMNELPVGRRVTDGPNVHCWVVHHSIS